MLDSEYNSLIDLAASKRESSLRRARASNTIRRILDMISGIIALISGGSITAVITDMTNSHVIKIMSAAFAFLSGIITLIISIGFDHKNIQKMYEGAGHSLALRERLMRARSRTDLSEKGYIEAYDRLSETELHPVSTGQSGIAR